MEHIPLPMHNITPLFKINARNVLLNRGIVVKNVFYVCFYFSIKKNIKICLLCFIMCMFFYLKTFIIY